MKTIHIGAALREGWLQFKRRPWYLIGLTLATFALMGMASGDGGFATALSYILYGGYVAVLLKYTLGDQVVFDDLFEIVDKRWIYFAFLGLIKMILILLGLLCFIVPGIYLSIRWMFADILVIDKAMRPLEALKASSALTEGVRWKLFFYTLLGFLLVVVGLFVFIVGAVVAALVIQLATIKLYRDLQSGNAGTATSDAPAQ